MKSSVCFVCLKTSSTLGGGDEETNRRLYSTFWRLAKDYLGILSSSASADKHRSLFCGECENVVSSICQLYRELLQVQLRLSSKLGELFGFMECSKSRVSYKLERLLSKSLAEQLGFQKPADVDAIRSLFRQKCKLKRSETLPQVIIERLETPVPKLVDVIKLEIAPEDNSYSSFSDSIEKADNPSLSRWRDRIPHIDDEGEVKEVDDGYDADEHPQIKIEPSELESEPEAMHHEPEDNIWEHPDSDSTSESSDSESDWATDDEKKNKQAVASTSKKKIPTRRPANHQQDKDDFSCPTCFKSFSSPKQRYNHIYNVHRGKRIPCLKCKKTFKMKSHLNEHIKACHTNETHICQQCQKVFRSRAYLRSHINKIHPQHSKKDEKSSIPTSEFPCPSCSLVLGNLGRLNHHINQVHSGRRHHCSECKNVSFKTKYNLQHHIFRFHKPEVHPCPFQDCKRTFPTKVCLRRHINTLHEKKRHEKQRKRRYKCPMCPMSYTSKELIDRHLETCVKSEEGTSKHSKPIPTGQEHKLNKCPTPNCSRSYFNSHALQRHLLTCEQTEKEFEENRKLEGNPCEEPEELLAPSDTEKQQHKCPTPNCSKSFLDKNALETHLLTCVQNEGESPEQNEFPCPSCHKTFPSTSKRRQHVSQVHKIKKFVCPSCNLTLKGRFALEQHMINIHNPESHPCSYCSKVFKSKRYLDCHMLSVHPDAEELPQERRSHRCPHCPKSFFLRQLLLQHLIICGRKHGYVTTRKKAKEETEDSPCPFCGKVFSSSSKVTAHIKNVHSDKQFVCYQCGVSLRSKTGLDEHITGAHKTEVHDCTQCKKSYKTGTHLKKHVDYVHNNGEERRRKYPCPNCPIAYNKKVKLELHLAKCSKEKPFYKRSISDPEGQRILRHDDTPDADGKFPCPHCPKVQSSASQRSRHVQNSHPVNLFTCDQCGVIRKTNAALQKHIIAYHTPKDRLCPHCGKTLATGYMPVHIKLVHPNLHQKKIRHSCPNCPEGYYTRHQFEKHSLECPGRNVAIVSENKTE